MGQDRFGLFFYSTSLTNPLWTVELLAFPIFSFPLRFPCLHDVTFRRHFGTSTFLSLCNMTTYYYFDLSRRSLLRTALTHGVAPDSQKFLQCHPHSHASHSNIVLYLFLLLCFGQNMHFYKDKTGRKTGRAGRS